MCPFDVDRINTLLWSVYPFYPMLSREISTNHFAVACCIDECICQNPSVGFATSPPRNGRLFDDDRRGDLLLSVCTAQKSIGCCIHSWGARADGWFIL